MRRLALALVVVVVVVVVAAVAFVRVAGAVPTIDVRARTRATIDAVVHTTGIHVRGTLTDALTGEGVVGRRVIVDIDGGRVQAEAIAGTGGRFDAYVDLPAGQYDIAVRFDGDEVYGDVATVPRPIDVDKAGLTLDVRVDGPLDASVAEVSARVSARSPEGPEAVPLAVRAGDAAGDAEPGATFAVATDEQGEATLAIPRARLGRPGEKRLVVRFEGSGALNPAEAETTFFLQTSTQLGDVRAPTGLVAFEADVEVTGKLVDADGKPVAGALILLGAGGKRVKETLTDGQGRFALRLPASDLGAGPHELRVAYESMIPWRRGARLGPFAIEIAAPAPVPVSYTLLTFALTAGAVLGYVLLRARPWQRLRAAYRGRRRKPEAAAVGAASPEEAAPAPGLRVARPTFMQSLRRATDHGFTGRVCDVVHGHAVGGARIVLRQGDRTVELHGDADGHFEIELSAGWWEAQVSARGYVTETVRAPIPHRGELRGARIDRQVAAPLLPRAELWGVWTPREILDHARAARPDGAFGQLTALVEETYFSVRVPDEDVIATAQASATAAAGELR
jgi:hypothetical protein